MDSYKHLTIEERETIFFLKAKGYSLRKIAKDICRSPSTVSRELARNASSGSYSPTYAHNNYKCNKKKCGRKLLLKSKILFDKVKFLFLNQQWSPEQIANRLKSEGFHLAISYNTIYRAIYLGLFDPPKLSHGNRGCIRLLRHRGKTRHTKSHQENRGRIRISYSIHDRPQIINDRERIGDWEADTVMGKTGKSCLVTLVDRKTGYLLCGKVPKKKSEFVKQKIVDLLGTLPNNKRLSITPDRGKEFSKHPEITSELDNIPFYFPDPHSPWQRGTNENTNGLIREYIAKGIDIDNITEEQIEHYVYKLNTRPRKRFDWKTPAELFNDKVLHLI